MSNTRIEIIAYRGQHGREDGDLLQTRSASITFCNRKAAELYATSPNVYGETVISPRVIEAEIVIEKPFMNEPTDPFLDMVNLVPVFGRKKAAEIAIRFSDVLTNTNNWYEIEEEHGAYLDVATFLEQHPADGLERLYGEAYHFFDDPAVIDGLRAAGYDGAVHGGSGETALEEEYRIFDPSQARIRRVDMLQPERPAVHSATRSNNMRRLA